MKFFLLALIICIFAALSSVAAPLPIPADELDARTAKDEPRYYPKDWRRAPSPAPEPAPAPVAEPEANKDWKREATKDWKREPEANKDWRRDESESESQGSTTDVDVDVDAGAHADFVIPPTWRRDTASTPSKPTGPHVAVISKDWRRDDVDPSDSEEERRRR